MDSTIYPTILTGFGVVITLIVTMHNLAKTNQQETNRRIDDLKTDLKELLDAKLELLDAKFKVIDSRFDVVDVRFRKLEDALTDLRHEVQEIKHVIFKPAA